MTSPDPRWPLPPCDPEQVPHILFLVTPPFSGSTAMAELLHTSPCIHLLQERAEGQWLVPGLSEDDRWMADKEVNYQSIRAVWLQAWQQAKARDSRLQVVVEKSPPNMMRLEQLLAIFPDHSLLANNRDPYANCSSILYRMHEPAQLNGVQRLECLQKLAWEWQLRSRKIRELVCRLDIPLLTYEEFCDAPARILTKLALPAGVAESIQVQAQVKVKDYPMQGIANQNQRQIDLLSAEERAAISRVLETDMELLDFFSCELA